MSYDVRRLDAQHEADFYRVHCDAEGTGWCYCAAWWVETWDGWSERTDAENRALRETLFARGEHDGYLLYEGDHPIAWCQVGPRDRLSKLSTSLELAPDPETWSITCFVVLPAHRGHGAAKALLAGMLDDLRARGVRRVEAYPKTGASEPGELWNGPRSMYEAAGFAVVRESAPRAVLALALAPPAS